MRGWLLSEQGQEEQGIAQMRRGLDAWQLMGIEVGQPYWLSLLAEAYARTSQVEETSRLLAEALFLVHKNAESWWEAELHRLKGRYC